MIHCTAERIRHWKLLVVSVSALVVGLGGLSLRAAAPTAPSNLVVTVDGLSATFNWTASANAPEYYVLAAGYSPGEIAVTVTLPAFPTSFSASAGPGTYYVRLYAVNADGVSPASNEVVVTLAPVCNTPTPPHNLRAMIRGTELFLSWRPSAGIVTSYLLQAGFSPGETVLQFATTDTIFKANVGSGTYTARVIATGPCGTSAASNEVTVTFPSNTVRVPDPEPGTILALPEIRDLIVRIHNENPGLIAQSCPLGVKYVNNPWQDRIVDRLRQYDTRFGYNAKPNRTSADNGGRPVLAAGDEITYFYGSGNAEGSNQVYAIDILFASCSDNPSLTYRDFTGQEEAIWTGAGRFSGDQRCSGFVDVRVKRKSRASVPRHEPLPADTARGWSHQPLATLRHQLKTAR